ncbi:MAG TPA: acylphosphatase [Longimicrobiaceae bacterium]|nr:acylphosphatase [Longimicrobiaceae bacterium]
MKEAAFRVRGRVQGVGFRWWTRSQATRLGLEGSVRNLPDGSVEVHLRGDDAAFHEMVRMLGHGPRGAHVENVEEVAAAHAPQASGFSILRG